MDSGGLSEVYLVVRPEERWVVARALDSRVGGYYSCFSAVGRGLEGGLVYRATKEKRRGRRATWRRHEPLAAMLPKVVFYMVVPSDMADLVLETACAAIRITGNPAECARGFGWVAPILGESPVGAVPVRPAPACVASLNGSSVAAREVLA